MLTGCLKFLSSWIESRSSSLMNFLVSHVVSFRHSRGLKLMFVEVSNGEDDPVNKLKD